MKIFYSTLLLVLLASCGDATPEQTLDTPEPIPPAVETTTQEIDAATEAMDDIQESSEQVSEEEIVVAPTPVAEEEVQADTLIELSTTYNNPKIEVVMDIDMTVDENDIIQSISVTSPNYSGMPEFNSGIQAVVGMSVEEASEYYVSGSSLTTPAFQEALKNR